MFYNNYICAIDIGSNKIAATLAQLKRGHLVNMFFEVMPSRGVKEGIIVDATELVTCLTKIIKSLKTKSGLKIDGVCNI